MNILSSALSKINIEEDKPTNTDEVHLVDLSTDTLVDKSPIYTEIETDSPYKYEEITNNGKVLRSIDGMFWDLYYQTNDKYVKSLYVSSIYIFTIL